jgi:hypothetical protein
VVHLLPAWMVYPWMATHTVLHTISLSILLAPTCAESQNQDCPRWCKGELRCRASTCAQCPGKDVHCRQGGVQQRSRHSSQANTTSRRASSRASDPDPGSPAIAALARSYESVGKLGAFTHFGADVANVSLLRAAVSQVAYRNELILLCGDGQAGGSPTALNTVLQFYALRLRHVLFVSDSARSCERLRAGLPGLACVWSSRVSRTKPQNDGGCVKRFWDMRFYFYDVRKHLVSVLAGEMGFNVLQTDTDVAWFNNPYGVLKSGENARANILAQWDAPFVNAGVFYAQGIRQGEAASWVLAELHKRIVTFMYTPQVVPSIVPWAKKPYFSNSDEQTLMNDVLISAMTNRTCYIWSTAFFESRYGGAGRARGWKGWSSTEESKQQPKLLRLCERSRLPGTELYPLHEPRGGPPSTFKKGSAALYAHYMYLMKHYIREPARLAAVRSVIDMDAAAAEAVREQRPTPYATHPQMTAMMVHLAGIRTGAWSRRAISRAHGWWHPEADALVGEEYNWGERGGRLRLSGTGVVRAPSRTELDMLIGNLMLLGLLLDRVVVIPETPCSFAPSPRGCKDGCAYDSVQTAPRFVGPARTAQRCAWLAPKRCWRTEFVTQLEYERHMARTTRQHAAAQGKEALSEATLADSAGRGLAAVNESEPGLSPNELPTPPSWPEGDEWTKSKPARRANTILQQGSARRSGGGKGAKEVFMRGTGKHIGVREGTRVRRGVMAAFDHSSSGLSNGQTTGPSAAFRAGMEGRCRQDGDWLIEHTIGAWQEGRFGEIGGELSRLRGRAGALPRQTDHLPANSTQAPSAAGNATRRALLRTLYTAVCASEGGTAAPSTNGAPMNLHQAAATPLSVHALMLQPLVGPPSVARGASSGAFSHKSQIAMYERLLRSLLQKMGARPQLSWVSKGMSRAANRSRASQVLEEDTRNGGALSLKHDIECIATLFSPSPPPPPPEANAAPAASLSHRGGGGGGPLGIGGSIGQRLARIVRASPKLGGASPG